MMMNQSAKRIVVVTAGLVGIFLSSAHATLADPWADGGSSIYVTDTSDLVGIGTTSPSTKLQLNYNGGSHWGLMLNNSYTGGRSWVVGDGVSAHGGFSIFDATASADRFFINSSGNIGIGTTSPATKLQVNYDGNSYWGFRLNNTYTGGHSWTLGDGRSAHGGFSIYDETSSADRFFINSSGNIGIGTTSPGSKLHINGDITVNNALQSGGALVFKTNSTTEQMRITTDGNVGIGNNSPDHKLVVNQTDDTNWAIKATSDSTSKGAIIGTASYEDDSNVVGVWGETNAPGSSTGSSIGVRGDAYAEVDTGGAAFGVLGYSHATDNSGTTSRPAGVYGGAYGPYGISGSGAPAVFDSHGLQIDGVQGETFANEAGSAGVYGAAHSTSTKVYGVAGYTSSESGGGAGVFGLHVPGSGVGKGVFGQSNSSSAGSYGVYFSGGLGGTGTKSAVVYTDMQGPTEMYALETPDNLFEDIGEGQLINGEARIEIDPLFLQTITVDSEHPIQVFIQPYGATNMYVERGTDAFTVRSINDPASTSSFGYRIIAKRQYYEDRRMRATPVEIDSAMRPDLSESEVRLLNERWNISWDSSNGF